MGLQLLRKILTSDGKISTIDYRIALVRFRTLESYTLNTVYDAGKGILSLKNVGGYSAKY